MKAATLLLTDRVRGQASQVRRGAQAADRGGMGTAHNDGHGAAVALARSRRRGGPAASGARLDRDPRAHGALNAFANCVITLSRLPKFFQFRTDPR